jgi:hypothetical protein|tara:strand:- start:67 stop:594 length:528 start_codon:yes stop_codon:yes gene_type:complete
MNKLVVFIFLILLFGGCNKGWNEDRDVDFGITYDISWDPLDLPNGFAEFRWIIEYKIIGDPDADTTPVTVMDIVLQEIYDGSGNGRIAQRHYWFMQDHKLKNYDHLEFKITTCSTSAAASWKHVKPINLELVFEAYSSFDDNKPDDRQIMESLFTVNSYDTTFYFTWSPPNLPLH